MTQGVGESRQELLHWLNSLLQLNITKVEQCGTGAALCQVYDSIYMDIPMSRVKFNINSEYAYVQNFKILQNCFTKHAIDRTVPIESLIKCRMQDNLEFLQWSKRHWDQYFSGQDYDAVARRKGSGGTPAAATAPAARMSGGGAARKPAVTTTSANRAAPRVGSAASGGVSSALKAENESLKEAIAGLEKERDFYFSKLRDIELLLQTAVDNDAELEKDENGLVKSIQAILYSTEDGFEIPAEVEGDANGAEEPDTF